MDLGCWAHSAHISSGGGQAESTQTRFGITLLLTSGNSSSPLGLWPSCLAYFHSADLGSHLTFLFVGNHSRHHCSLSRQSGILGWMLKLSFLALDLWCVLGSPLWLSHWLCSWPSLSTLAFIQAIEFDFISFISEVVFDSLLRGEGGAEREGGGGSEYV